MTTVIDTLAMAAKRVHPPKHPDQAVAECATCPGHCCKGDAIVLHPDEGDLAALYQTEVMAHPLTGRPVQMLAHKPNGDCVYLAEVGGVGRCSIYERRPVICRTFDCGRSYASMDRATRRQWVRQGLMSKDVMTMGRKVQERRASRKLQDGR